MFHLYCVKYETSVDLPQQIEGEETLKCRCVCQPPCGKFNVISKDHGRTQKFDFSVFNGKYPFWVNLVEKIKIVSLT